LVVVVVVVVGSEDWVIERKRSDPAVQKLKDVLKSIPMNAKEHQWDELDPKFEVPSSPFALVDDFNELISPSTSWWLSDFVHRLGR